MLFPNENTKQKHDTHGNNACIINFSLIISIYTQRPINKTRYLKIAIYINFVELVVRRCTLSDACSYLYHVFYFTLSIFVLLDFHYM